MTEDEQSRGRGAIHITFLGTLAFSFLIGVGPTFCARQAEAASCSGCGCKGGPGYRGPNGRCVGWDALAETCGSPPTSRCKAEQVNVRQPAAPAQRERSPAPQRQAPATQTVPNPF
ncbi:hypothetical protein [Methylobacterium oryzisoli]|uniref:hypothetical protein n=1 Tax=Methylobacterium oryzisoli TaxID=3385502 RepID=UPI003892C9B2